MWQLCLILTSPLSSLKMSSSEKGQTLKKKVEEKIMFLTIFGHIGFGGPTNIVSVSLVVGCPNARAGVKIVKKRTLRAT